MKRMDFYELSHAMIKPRSASSCAAVFISNMLSLAFAKCRKLGS